MTNLHVPTGGAQSCVSGKRLSYLLERYAKKDYNIVLVSSHDLMYVYKIGTQICVLNEIRLVFDGTKEEFTENGSMSIDLSLLNLINNRELRTEGLTWLI